MTGHDVEIIRQAAMVLAGHEAGALSRQLTEVAQRLADELSAPHGGPRP